MIMTREQLLREAVGENLRSQLDDAVQRYDDEHRNDKELSPEVQHRIADEIHSHQDWHKTVDSKDIPVDPDRKTVQGQARPALLRTVIIRRVGLMEQKSIQRGTEPLSYYIFDSRFGQKSRN